MKTTATEAGLKAHARALYLGGHSLEQAAAEAGAPLKRVRAWAAAGGWDARRRAWLSDPRGAAASLRQVLGHKVEAILALGDLDKGQADELAKIAAALAKLENTGYDLKAAAVEIGERLARFAAGWESAGERRAWLGDLLDAFFAALGKEA